MDIAQFKQTLAQLLFDGKPVTYYHPTIEDQISIRKIVENEIFNLGLELWEQSAFYNQAHLSTEWQEPGNLA